MGKYGIMKWKGKMTAAISSGKRRIKTMDNKAYLDELVNELMVDPTWQFPPQMRIFLKMDLVWSLLSI